MPISKLQLILKGLDLRPEIHHLLLGLGPRRLLGGQRFLQAHDPGVSLGDRAFEFRDRVIELALERVVLLLGHASGAQGEREGEDQPRASVEHRWQLAPGSGETQSQKLR